MRVLFAVGIVKVAAGLAAVAWISESVPLPARALPTWYYLTLLLIFGFAGAAMFVGGRDDPRARALGVVLLLFGTLFTERLASRALPAMSSGSSVVLGTLTELHVNALAPYALWRFAWIFPLTQAALVPPWVPVVLGRLALISGALFACGSVLLSFLLHLDLQSSPMRWLSPDADGGWFWQTLALLTLPSLGLLVLKQQTAAVNERRRLAWVVVGILVGVAPMVLHVLLAATLNSYAQWSDEPTRSRLIGIALTAFSLSIPFATAYAVVMDRVLDVSFVVRRAVQYVLARYTVVGLMFGLGIAIATITYVNRHRPLAEILSDSPLLVATVVLAVALFRWRRQLLDGIDRRFFREHYDATRILGDLVDSSQKAQTTREIVRLITGEIDRALHLERIALLLLDKDNNQLTDPDGQIRGVNVNGALGSLIAASHTPFDIDLSSDGSPLKRLPHAEREWLVDAGARLMVPLFGGDDRPLGVIALGEKRSELPFTAEDRKLMIAVAASTAATLEQKLRHESGQPEEPRSIAEPARQCVTCGRVQARHLIMCHACGNAVRDALLPMVLAGKFELDRQVGAGGMGVVYRARDLNLQRFVALKVLPRIESHAASRLRREARVMATIQHPHLAIVHSLESWRGSPVLVLEYLSGGTLAERLPLERLPVASVVSLGSVLGRVLHHVHRAGYLHRDVKPSNIGYTEHGLAKLLDFGLVRLLNQMSSFTDLSEATTMEMFAGESADVRTSRSGDRMLVGTPAYLPPEALRGARPNTRLDLWGLSVTLYEAFTGRNPFRARTVAETLSLVEEGAVPSAKLARPDCPDGLADFFTVALSVDSTRRPQSAAEFVERLNASVPNVVAPAM